MSEQTSTASGPGRVLVAVYAVFAVSASARSIYQLATDFDAAPVAYLLSAAAAAVYVVATIAFGRSARVVAWAATSTELVGVVTVGALSRSEPQWFADATVWSDFGQGYGYVPAVLPLLGLAWLARTRT